LRGLAGCSLGKADLRNRQNEFPIASISSVNKIIRPSSAK